MDTSGPPPPSPRQQQCYQAILAFLDSEKVDYKTVHHTETFTSEESARVRGVPLSTGGKAILLKISGGSTASGRFSLFVISASRKLNSKAVKKELKRRGRTCKDVRFATNEELAEITSGLVPGCVPPFGKPILGTDSNDDDENNGGYLELYVDTSIESNQTIAFNAGSLTDSVIMSVLDYLRIAEPSGVFEFSKP